MSNAISTTATSMSWNAVSIPSLGNVQATASREVIDVTPIGVDFRSNIFGPQNWTITAEVFLNETDHTALQTDWQAKTKRELIITWASGYTWTGDAYITSIDVTAGTTDAVRATVQFQSHGEAVTFA
jgi:hypothetical protein